MNKSPWIIENRKIKIALVGCGKISANHFKAIAQFPDHLQLAAVCDAHAPTLAEAVQQTGAKGYDNYSALLQDPEIDVVALCTASGLHAEQTIAAARAGKHVITEKPMATRWQDGLSMIKICDAEQVRLFVVKQNRFHPTLQLLKQAISENRFGRIYFIGVNVFWTRPQSYYDTARWRGTWEFDGGALMNQASHYVDLLTWLFGPVQNVQAMMATLGRNIEVEDTASLTLRWRNGALGSMNVTMLAYPKNFEASLTIMGERGTVRIGGVAVNEIQHWQFAEPHTMDEQVAAVNQLTQQQAGTGHSNYYQNFIEVMRGKILPETDGREGIKSLEVLTAAYRAARDQCQITLPLVL